MGNSFIATEFSFPCQALGADSVSHFCGELWMNGLRVYRATMSQRLVARESSQEDEHGSRKPSDTRVSLMHVRRLSTRLMPMQANPTRRNHAELYRPVERHFHRTDNRFLQRHARASIDGQGGKRASDLQRPFIQQHETQFL
jgi:hypothetical protein